MDSFTSVFLLLSFCIIKCCMCFSNCSEGDLQLDNSTSPPLVMMCVQRQWGYICGRQAPNSPWTQENVGVACQQLGFVREASGVQIPQLSERISNDLRVHYRFVQCTGVERRLIDCAHGASPADHITCRRDGTFRYGAVSCSEKSVVCEAGEVKIINNTLVICSQGEWYTLCGDTNSWTQTQARVACRQMGLNPNGSLASSLDFTSQQLQLLRTMFHCTGSETSLIECPSSIIQCSNGSVAGITCGRDEASEVVSSEITETIETAITTVVMTANPFTTTSSVRLSSIHNVHTESNVLLSASSLMYPLPWVIGVFVGNVSGAAITIIIFCIIYKRKKKSSLKTYENITTKVSDRSPPLEQHFSMTSNPTYTQSWKCDRDEVENDYAVPLSNQT